MLKDSLKLGMTVSYRTTTGKQYIGTLISTDTVQVTTSSNTTQDCIKITTLNNEQIVVPLKRCKLVLESNKPQVKEDYYKLYIIVRSDVPDHMVPVLVAHTMLSANDHYEEDEIYKEWKEKSFRKVVVKTKDYSEYERLVKEFPNSYEGHENTTCNGEPTCLIPVPVLNNSVPGKLRSLSLWKPSK